MMALTANDPEQAHELAINFLASGLAPVDCGIDDEVLATEVSRARSRAEAGTKDAHERSAERGKESTKLRPS